MLNIKCAGQECVLRNTCLRYDVAAIPATFAQENGCAYYRSNKVSRMDVQDKVDVPSLLKPQGV